MIAPIGPAIISIAPMIAVMIPLILKCVAVALLMAAEILISS